MISVVIDRNKCWCLILFQFYYSRVSTMNYYFYTNISINEMANASPKDKELPIQFLKMNISPIKLIITICPACMLAYRRINNENGFINIPKTSIGINIIYNLRYGNKISFNGLSIFKLFESILSLNHLTFDSQYVLSKASSLNSFKIYCQINT